MSDEELQEQFRRCKTWNEPEQWDALAAMYQARGYVLNAEYCANEARVLRVADMSPEERDFITKWIV